MAFLVAFLAVYAWQLMTQDDPVAQASSGMYAFGDLLLFLAVFGVAALLPTGLALYFLQPFRKFWLALAIALLAFALTGPVAVAVNVWKSGLPLDQPFWMILVPVTFLRMFGALLLAASFMLFALLAPTRLSRRLILGAAAIEAFIGAYALYHWLGLMGLL